MSPVKTAPAALTAGDAALRAQYLPRCSALLYPRRARPTATAASRSPSTWSCPTPRRPAAAGAGRRRAGSPPPRSAGTPSRSPALARLKRDAVVAALRTGASPAAAARPGAGHRPAADTHRRPTCARRSAATCALSVHIGPARANRKPVLQLLGAGRRHVGFAKLGTGAADPAAWCGPRPTALTALADAGLTDAHRAAGAARRAVARARGAGPVGAAGLAAARRR